VKYPKVKVNREFKNIRYVEFIKNKKKEKEKRKEIVYYRLF